MVMNYLHRFRVAPGSKVKLGRLDPGFTDRHESHEQAAGEIEHYQQRVCASFRSCSTPNAATRF